MQIEKKRGILLVNIGTPKSLDYKSVKNYLSKFLMDKYVIFIPYLFRLLLVKGFIIPFRINKVLNSYRAIAINDRLPLQIYMEDLANRLSKHISLPVEIGMRYGEPSIEKGIQNLMNQHVTNIYILPLFPQYTLSTVESTNQYVERILQKYPTITYQIISPFYNKRPYIELLANKIRNYLNPNAHLLFSFHGIPLSHLRQVCPYSSCSLDSEKVEENPNCLVRCYWAQCHVSARMIAKELGLTEKQWSVAFQSRLGRQKWLEPYFLNHIQFLRKQGITNLCVVAPSFTTDCLETIHEIPDLVNKYFIQKPTDSFTLIPCLNADKEWVEVIEQLIHESRV